MFRFAFCYCDKHSDQEPLPGERGLFTLHFQVIVGYLVKPGQGLKHKPQQKTWKTLFTGSLTRMLGYLSFTAQELLPRDGTTHNGLGRHTSIAS